MRIGMDNQDNSNHRDANASSQTWCSMIAMLEWNNSATTPQYLGANVPVARSRHIGIVGKPD